MRKELYSLVRRDYPDHEVTEETIRAGVRSQYAGGCSAPSMREATGRVWTTKAFEERRRKVLSTPVHD